MYNCLKEIWFCSLVWMTTKQVKLQERSSLHIFVPSSICQNLRSHRNPWLQHQHHQSLSYFITHQLVHHIFFLCSRWCQRQFARLLPSRKIWLSLIGFMNWLARDKMKTKTILWLDFPVGEHTVITLSQPII